MGIFWRGVLAVIGLGLCGAAAAADPHLLSSESAALRSGVTILFLEPEAELGAYLRQNVGVDIPPNGGAIGGAGAGIAASIVQSHRVNEFMEAMQPYADIIGKQHFTDQEYAALRGAVSGLPWAQKADWQRLPATTDRRRVLGMMKNMHTQAALLVMPETLIRDDLDQLQVGYRVELYVRDPFADGGVNRLRNSEFTRVSPDPAGDAFPALDYMKSDSDVAAARHLQAFFADGGTHLGQYFQGALPVLRSQLIYYFTGVMPPAPSTVVAAPSAATAASRP